MYSERHFLSFFFYSGKQTDASKQLQPSVEECGHHMENVQSLSETALHTQRWQDESEWKCVQWLDCHMMFFSLVT